MKIARVIFASLVGIAILGYIINSRLPEGFDLAMPEINRATSHESDLPKLGLMPEFVDITSWLNSAPLTTNDLRGKVVLIDFWTYSCINCIRTLPYVTGWYEKYKDQGFVVIGVHTPEFAFEKKRDNVAEAIERYQITYPVAQDNDYATWQAYSNRYWPAHYLFDAEGNLRYTHFGEGKYDVTETNIRTLLAEAGNTVTQSNLRGPDAPDFQKILTPETYLGYERASLLGSPEKVRRNTAMEYSATNQPELNKFYLSGAWRVEPERIISSEAGASIVYRYHAATANLVMSPSTSGAVRVRVTLDGSPVPVNLRGEDIIEEQGKTYVVVNEERLYTLIDAKGAYAEHVLQVEFEQSGIGAYAFTFG